MKITPKRFMVFLVSLLLTSSLFAAEQELVVTSSNVRGAIPLVSEQGATPILIDKSDAEVVSIVAGALSSDLNLITGKKPGVINTVEKEYEYAIIAGTIGRSFFIDNLISSGKLNVSAIKNKWECFTITTIDNPQKGIKKAIVIAGSDRRGTAYGLFEISKRAGVSPWVFWADVTPEKRASLYLIPGTYVSTEPSVKYRGIFINDEDWGLNVWARKNIDTDVKDIGPKTYALVYELLLRLRANFIWPAMHDSTKAFFYYKDNPVVADQYAIVMGSTHCDQMLRSNTFEWQKNFATEYGEEPKEYRYDINKKQVYRYWDDRVNETKNYESFYTIGMRGVRDGSIQGPKTREDKIALMDTIIRDQRGIFSKYFGHVDGVPQLFCPYKEVLDLYNGGLEIPDDVTLVWTDDNYGYIRRLSTPEEQKRSGSGGVYYHLSYLGNPHDYTWLSTNSPSLVSYEMTKAFQFGADRLWVVNVGDIKPAELEIQFFLDMAWDSKLWIPEKASDYLMEWAAQTFGKDLAPAIANIKKHYYNLAQTGKPEHLAIVKYDAQTRAARLKASEELIQLVDELKSKVPQRLQDAFFQLVEYPVKGMALINEKIDYAAMCFEVAGTDINLATQYSAKAWKAYNDIQVLTYHYNHEIENGKWDGIITDSPRHLKVYGMPEVAVKNVVTDPSVYEQDYKSTYIYRGEPFTIDISRGIYSATANQYSEKQDNPGDSIIVIDGLGLDGKSISRYPFYNPSFSKEEFKKAPHVTYHFTLKPDAYDISLKCLPTRSINKDRKLQLAIVVDGGAPQFADANYDREDDKWRVNVLQGFIDIKLPVSFTNSSEHTLSIYLLDTGLAVSRIDFNKANN